MPPQKPSESNRRLGWYDLLEKVGHGGMSTVFKACDTRTQEVVAVKVASRSVINDPFASRRFELEFQVAQPLEHPNLAKVFDYQFHNEIPYLVMEYVDGPSLAHHLKIEGYLEEPAALALFVQVADALNYLHARQLIHRDIKPGNILLTSQGQAKLVDLGLSKNLESLAELTRSKTGLGTMQFAAPEQFEDARSADVRSDVYSLAATLYLALVGEPPFGLGGTFSVLQRKLKNQFSNPISKKPSISPRIDAAIRMGLQAARERRPNSVLEFMAFVTGAQPVPASEELPDTVLLPEEKSSSKAVVSASERRASLRYAAEMESNCRPLASAKNDRWPAVIKDISTTGVSLLVKRRFEVGNVLDILLTLQQDDTAQTQAVRVRRVKPADTSGWLLGCEFISALEEQDLETFFNERMNKTDMT